MEAQAKCEKGISDCDVMLKEIEKGRFEFDRFGNFRFMEEELNIPSFLKENFEF